MTNFLDGKISGYSEVRPGSREADSSEQAVRNGALLAAEKNGVTIRIEIRSCDTFLSR
jgi:hypothetical protein